MILVFDMSYWAWVAAYTTGGLKRADGEPTGVRYGVFKKIFGFRDTHPRATCVFCFDADRYFRTDEYPEYKAGRIDEDEPLEKKMMRKDLHHELLQMRTIDLPQMGFFNLHCTGGYEADDMIAQVVRNRGDQEAIVYSGDEDLWQVLDDGVYWQNNKGRVVTRASFEEEWGFHPKGWSQVKALAGCKSDNVVGIHRVGEVKAAEFLRGEMNPKSKTHAKITEALRDQKEHFRLNRKLVTLPWPGCAVHNVVPDVAFSERKKNKVYKALEFNLIQEGFNQAGPEKRDVDKGFF